MSRLGRVVGSFALVLAMLTGGYVMADIYDFVPGMLTLRERPPEPAPFPTPPGAVAPDTTQALAAGVSPLAPKVSNLAQVDALVADFVGKEEHLGPHIGIVLTDSITGQRIVELRPNDTFIPASTAKTLTSFAALDRLGPHHTFATTVVQDGVDTLTLVGGGDVLLSAGVGEPSQTVGHAGLADLADQTVTKLNAAGLTSVTLNLDDSVFSSPVIHGRWPNNSLGRGYVSAIMPLAIDGGKIPGTGGNSRSADPALDAANTFSTLLTERGIAVTGKVRRVNAPSSATEIARVESAPLWQLVDHLMSRSDNTVTEVVCRMIAAETGLPTNFSGGTQAVINQLNLAGLNTSGLKLSDCSGLAEGSSLTPNLLIELITKINTEPASPYLAVLTGMAQGGVDGTLVQRFTEGPARGQVRAKTGSLNSVTTLAGTLVTVDGRELIFAVLIDQAPIDQSWNTRATLDAFIQGLTRCGCTL